MTVNGVHRYVLFGIGDDQIEDAGGLGWQDCFTFLYDHSKPNTAFVGFYLGYDFTQIIKTLPRDRAYLLLTADGKALRKHRVPGKVPHPVECQGWQFDVLGMKRLRLRPKGCDCPVATCECKHDPWMYVCDVGGYFQSSFLTVINPKGWAVGSEIVTREEYATIEKGKERRSTAVLDDDMRRYNCLENDVLGRVMTTLDAGLHEIGIHLPASKWFGPGQAAQAWLKREKVPTRIDHDGIAPVWFLEAARMSYYGGWFEQFIHGIIPGDSHEYDINSAYPSIIAELPCLLHGTYSRGNGVPEVGPNELCLVYASVWAPGMPKRSRTQYIGSMLHRDGSGRILRPLATEGWYWWDELRAASRVGLVKRLDNGGSQQIQRWIKYRPCDCPPPMRAIRDLYRKRLEVGKKTPLGKSAKLTYNSGYGKFAQSIGDPIFGNPVYASRITAGCRAMILGAIASHPHGARAVSMVATDAVYFLSPHPTLPLSSELGEWDYTQRHNLTLFKPGVYWDDSARERIARGESPHFKARGFKASDFAASIGEVDRVFRSWDTDYRDGCSPQTWPSVEFTPSFSMVTGLQALRRNDWSLAGRVEAGVKLTQNADPSEKRQGLYRDNYDGRMVYRSSPHFGMTLQEGKLRWVASHPYTKRFGMDDPWSDEYKGQLGETPDGMISDILAWILTGE